MLLVRWLPKARANLTTIIDYIAERNDVAASKLQDDIERATSQLPHHPYLYRVGRLAGTREIVVHDNYVSVPSVLPPVIEIEPGVHSASDILPKRR